MAALTFLKFSEVDRFLLDISPELFPILDNDIPHWKDRRTFLSQLQFLVYYWNVKTIKSPKLLYIGAGPSKHIQLLAVMFPKVEFHIFSSEEYAGEESDNVITHKIFRDKNIKEWKDRDDVLLVSDLNDMEEQDRLYRAIKPVKALLKFKPEGNTSLDYLDGILWHTIWTNPNSLTTYLVPNGTVEKKWNIKSYNAKMVAFNNESKGKKYMNPITGERNAINGTLGTDRSSSAETSLLSDYLIKYQGVSTDIDKRVEDVIALSALITKTLKTKKRKTILQLSPIEKKEEVKPVKKIAPKNIGPSILDNLISDSPPKEEKEDADEPVKVEEKKPTRVARVRKEH